jgi:leucyl-tRNA---protein transferase
MEQTITLFESPDTPCPYLPDRVWRTRLFFADSFSGQVYESLLAFGFRRSGTHFYQNTCPGCNSCRQLRIPVARFAPSRSQERTLKKNRDMEIVIEASDFQKEVYELYLRYADFKHGKEEDDEAGFRKFLCDTPIDTRIMKYYSGSRLAGVGWLDLLPNGLSSVYFAFDPDFASRSLGTYSVLREVELCRKTGREWHYFGFHVEGSAKMNYKARFRPHEKLVDGVFREFD